MHVITAPRPGRAIRLAPVLARGTLTGGTSRSPRSNTTSPQPKPSPGLKATTSAPPTVAPSGVWINGGVLARPPLGALSSSIGINPVGTVHVERVRLFGTWQGTGSAAHAVRAQRAAGAGPDRPLHLRVRASYPGRRRRRRGRARVVPGDRAEYRPRRGRHGDRVGRRRAHPARRRRADGGRSDRIEAAEGGSTPSGRRSGAGSACSPPGTVSPRHSAAGRCSFETGRRCFARSRTSRMIRSASRTARAAVGQLADGRSSSWPSTAAAGLQRRPHELRARAGARPARRSHRSRRRSRRLRTAAFDGRLLNRPSGRAERAVKEGLHRVLRRLRARADASAPHRRARSRQRAALLQDRRPLDGDRRPRRPRRRASTRSRAVYAPGGHVRIHRRFVRPGRDVALERLSH